VSGVASRVNTFFVTAILACCWRMLDPQTEHWLTNGLTEVTTDTTDTTAHNKQPIPVSAHRLETTVCI